MHDETLEQQDSVGRFGKDVCGLCSLPLTFTTFPTFTCLWDLLLAPQRRGGSLTAVGGELGILHYQ